MTLEYYEVEAEDKTRIDKVSKEWREEYLRRIVASYSFEMAWCYKKEMNEKMIPGNAAVYYELLQKCRCEEDVFEIKKEMDIDEVKINEKTFITMYRKLKSENAKRELIKEMEEAGLSLTIKGYDVLIKLARNAWGQA